MDEADQKNLKLRILSAAVIIPFVSAAIYFGGVFYAALIGVFAFAALYEWNMLAAKTDKTALLLVAGFLYVAVVSVVLWFLRSLGWELVMFFFVSVWLSDTCGYLFGRFFKGPKLLPSVSPNKTWSGLIGACLGPCLLAAYAYHYIAVRIIDEQTAFISEDFVLFVLYGLTIGVSGQVGDLLISKIKRMADVKDSGSLIPGHGGVLDRIDSLMMASLFVSVLLGLLLMFTSGLEF